MWIEENNRKKRDERNELIREEKRFF